MISCARLPELPGTGFFLGLVTVASNALGVFNKMGDKPASVPSVGSADTASRYNVRLHFVSCRLQVRAHLIEDQSFRPINNSENILAHDPTGSNNPNNVEHRGPEVPCVIRTLPFARERERLAGEAAGKDIDASSPNGKVCCPYV
jgi:hypothetical protein